MAGVLINASFVLTSASNFERLLQPSATKLRFVVVAGERNIYGSCRDTRQKSQVHIAVKLFENHRRNLLRNFNESNSCMH